VKEWLKSVLNYRSYPKNKIGYPFFGTLCIFLSFAHCFSGLLYLESFRVSVFDIFAVKKQQQQTRIISNK